MVRSVGFENLNSEKELKVYPNPSNGKTYLRVSENFVGGEYTLRNILGKPVLRSRINQLELNFEIQGSNGIYFLEVIDR